MTYERAVARAKERTAAGTPTRIRPVRRVPGGWGTWTYTTVEPRPHWSQRLPDRVRRGEQINTAKLNEDAVRAVRSEYVAGVEADALSKRFGVSTVQISNIVKRRSWKHVP
jgi:hypothetical protein